MKKILLLLLVIIVGAAIFIKTINVNKYKPLIETALYDATGYKVKINGRISVSLMPFGVLLPQISITNPTSFYKQDIGNIKAIKIGINPIALFFHKNLKIDSIRVENPVIYVVKSKNGILNTAVKPKKHKNKNNTKGFAISKVAIINAIIAYKDLKDNKTIFIKGVKINGSIKDDANGIQTKGIIKAATLKINNIQPIKNFSARFSLNDNILNISFLKYQFFGSKAQGSISIDFSQDGVCEARQTIQKLNLKTLSKTLYKNITLEGYAYVNLNLYFDLYDINKSLNGLFIAKGKNITLKGENLDKIIEGIEKTGSINFIDIGSFFIVGPLGILADKAYSIGYTAKGLNGQTHIRDLVFKVKIINGKGYLKDMAFSTDKNRIAAKGVLNFINKRYENVRVAILDKKGCAKIIQRIEGSFSNPKVELGRTVVGTIVNKVKTFFKKLEKSVGIKNTKCTPFYTGVVQQP